MKHIALVLGLAIFGCAAAAAQAGSFNGTPGLQLYSLRAEFAKDVPGTLKLARELGFRDVELAGTCGLAPEKFKALLAENGLKPIGNHFPYERFRDDVEGIAKEAMALGLKYAGCAWIPHQDPFDEAQCRQAAAVFNRAGEALAKHGIRFYYHVHGYEFQPHGDGTLFDLLMAETNPKYVNYEMDILWVVFPGQDPVKLLQKYGRRFVMMHLKDLRKGVPTGSLSGSTDVRNDVALGTGQMDFRAIFKAAQRAGVKYYFIEDESPSSVQQLPQSLSYVEHLKF